MRVLFFVFISALYIAFGSCSSSTSKTFCDTACNSDSINFTGTHAAVPVLAIGLKTCKADTIFWSHNYSDSRTASLSEYLGMPVRLNKSAVDCFFKDSLYAWLQFNDCISGRGFLLKLNFSKIRDNRKITGALTRFDPKFSIDKELIAYTDRGSVFVENLETEAKATLPFDKSYEINFNKLHDAVDSVNITKNRIWIQMIREGEKKVYEKKISL